MSSYIIYLLYHFALFSLSGELINSILKTKLHWTDKNIFGIIIYTIIASIYQILFPLNICFSLSLFLLVLIIVYLKNKSYFNNFKITKVKYYIYFIILIYPLWKIIPRIYDHYLYHDQVIAWFNKYNLSLGLGNLHGRFAFNNSLFPTISSFQTNYHSNHYYINIYLLYLFLCKVKSLLQLKKTLTQKIGIITFAFGVFIYGIPYYSNVSPDFQVVVFISFVFLNFVYKNINHNSFRYHIALSIFSMTIKLNYAPFLLFIIIYLSIKHFKNVNKIDFKSYILPTLITIVWISRSLILSGQIVYPFPPLFSDKLKHSVSIEQTTNELISVTGWAQSPGKGFKERYLKNKGTLKWVPKWFNSSFNQVYSSIPLIGIISIRIFAIFTFFNGITILFYFLSKKEFEKLFFAFSIVINVVYWFFTGPDYRFGFLNFQMLFVLPFIYEINIKSIKLIFFLFIIITSPFQLYNIGRIIFRCYRSSAYQLMNPKFDKLNKSSTLLRDFIVSKQSKDTFFYYYPTNGDKSPDNEFPIIPKKLKNVGFEIKNNRLLFFRKN